MAKNIYRYEKSAYGKQGEQLPNQLKFLTKLRFCAVIEDQSGSHPQIRIEMLPSTLKRLLSALELHKKIAQPNIDAISYKDQQIENLQNQLYALQRANQTLREELSVACKSAENANEKLATFNQATTNRTSDTEFSGPLTGYLSRADDSGFKAHGLPLQGGLPSLPKRR